MAENYIVLEGKNLNSLIEDGLQKLNKSREEVDVEIIQEDIGLFAKKFKIKVSCKENHSDKAEDVNVDTILKNISDISTIKDSFEIKYLNDGVYLTIYDSLYRSEILAKRILNRIERKKIVNYDAQKVEQIISELNCELVKIAPPQEEHLIDAELIIDITDKNMKAYMTLLPPLGGKNISYDEAISIIKQQIIFGLVDEEVENIIYNRIYNKKILIAKGKQSVDGKDGYIEYHFNTNKSSKRVRTLEDGSVDFRNLNLIENTQRGDVLAEMTLPIKGEKGFNVIGEIVEPKEGKFATFNYGKNVVVSDDRMKLFADRDGQVTLEGEKVVVHEVFAVDGNVDNTTGNVDFKGMVKIKGNVRTGFRVKAEGDIEISGVVEAANIECYSNIILKRGMQGHNRGKLIAKGDIIARYLENAYLFSHGAIKSEAIMHSRIFSRDTIEVTGKKGLIVGGECKAKYEVHAKIIGSSMSTFTEIEVGVDPNIKAECNNMKSKISEIEEHIEKLDKSITLLNKLAQSNRLTVDKKEILIRCLNDRNVLFNNYNNLKLDLYHLESESESLSKGKVVVRDVIYPGVKIVIGNSVMFIKKEYKHCTFYKEDGEIKVGPYNL